MMRGDSLEKIYKDKRRIKYIEEYLEIVVSLMLFIAMLIGTGMLFSEHTTEKLYHDELLKISDDMDRIVVDTNRIANVYIKVWSKGIIRDITTEEYANLIGVKESIFIEKIEITSNMKNNKSDDQELSKIIEYVSIFYSQNGEIDSIDNKLNRISKSLERLNNPPDIYIEAYDITFERYSDLIIFYNNIISPKGSLNSYKKYIEDGNKNLIDKCDKIMLNIENNTVNKEPY